MQELELGKERKDRDNEKVREREGERDIPVLTPICHKMGIQFAYRSDAHFKPSRQVLLPKMRKEEKWYEKPEERKRKRDKTRSVRCHSISHCQPICYLCQMLPFRIFSLQKWILPFNDKVWNGKTG